MIYIIINCNVVSDSWKTLLLTLVTVFLQNCQFNIQKIGPSAHDVKYCIYTLHLKNNVNFKFWCEVTFAIIFHHNTVIGK